MMMMMIHHQGITFLFFAAAAASTTLTWKECEAFSSSHHLSQSKQLSWLSTYHQTTRTRSHRAFPTLSDKTIHRTIGILQSAKHDKEEEEEEHDLSNNFKSTQLSTEKTTVKNRRDIMKHIGTALLSTAAITIPNNNNNNNANAAVTDETRAFANNSPDSSYSNLSTNPNIPPTSPILPKESATTATTTPSDEVTITVRKSDLTKGGLGLELGEINFRTNVRVVVKSISPNSLASKLGIQKDWVVVAVNGESAERTNAEGVAIMVSRAVRSTTTTTTLDDDDENGTITLRFRDPAVFSNALKDLSSVPGGEITTQVAPAGDTTQRNADGSIKRGGEVVTAQEDQRVTVSQLVPPKMCTRGAEVDDLLEISYVGTVVDTGDVFDGSAVKINGQGIPGRGNDVTIFFVLKKQPFGQFPPGFDVGLEGICVGERRRLIIPPVLAYGSQGLPRRGVPPNATIQYDVTLISLNGLATPQ